MTATTLTGVIRPAPVDDPQVRLILLHHAGGSHGVYRGWIRDLPGRYDMCLVEAPGRGRLGRLPAKRRMPELIDHLLDDLAPWLNRPVAVWGHSMGGLVGYELVRAMRDRGLPLPVWLGISGHPCPENAEFDHAYRLPSGRFRDLLGRLGGVPEPILADPELWAVFEPLLRADLELIQTWRPTPDTAPLPVPISVFAGDHDAVAGPEQMRGWASRTTEFLGLRTFPGGHFYLREQQAPLVGRIVADVRAVLGRTW
jgi:surfactin synthase thioesterase subunit